MSGLEKMEDLWCIDKIIPKQSDIYIFRYFIGKDMTFSEFLTFQDLGVSIKSSICLTSN